MDRYGLPVHVLVICLINTVLTTPFLEATMPSLAGRGNDTAGP